MKQAVILAAGEGQRLRPFTVDRPKVMLSIGDKPILQYVIESLAQNGIRRIVLIVGYRKEQVCDFLGSGECLGVEITYITQERQLGTAHALLQAKAVTDAEFLAISGDNLIEANTIAEFMTAKPEAMLVKRSDSPAKYGVVTFKRGAVKGITENPKAAKSNLINTGIYAFTREIFSFIESELDIPDALNKMLAQGYAINSVETTGTWLDAVYPWDILTLNDIALRKTPAELGGTIEPCVSLKGAVSVGKNTVIHSNSYLVGPIVIGDSCEIGPNVCLLPATSISDNVVISPFTEIENSVIGSDVSIGPGCIIQNSVIDRGCTIKGHFTAYSGQTEIKSNQEYHLVDIGAMLGWGCNVGNNVVAQPGTIVGNCSQIQALKSISGRLHDRSLVL